MRKLNLTDVFRFSRLVKDSGLRDTVSDTLKAAAEIKAKPAVNDGDLYNIGIDAFMSVVDMAAWNPASTSSFPRCGAWALMRLPTWIWMPWRQTSGK